MNRYIAVQIGARRAYALPYILERAGLLEAFYTDLCGNVGAGRLISNCIPKPFRHKRITALAARRVPDKIRDKTKTFPLPTMSFYFQYYYLKQKKDNTNVNPLWDYFHDCLGKSMIRKGIGHATHIFSMAGECTPFLEYARNQGLTIVTEFYSMPSYWNILDPEYKKFPGWDPLPTEANIKIYNSWQKNICSLTDWAIVPSVHVRDDLINNFGFPPTKCFVVPYAMHDDWLTVKNEPNEGRVLFVGSTDIRKGIHYLGLASQIINNQKYQFRIVGATNHAVLSHPITQKFNFIGFVPRAEVKDEFKKADIFVLPSLAEGSAEVTYEALAVGLPIVTTESTGSVIRDGKEGFIVPERDPEALAARIIQLVEDRALRQRMAEASKKRAYDFTWKKYTERLLAVFGQIP